jgi:hypothetical protein
MHAPGLTPAAQQGLEKSGRDAATSSTEAPLSQALAALGWTVERPSRLTLKLTKAGSVLFASARRRHRSNTLMRVAEADEFAARRRRP